MTRRGWIYFIVLGILWGLPYLLIKVSVREISPPLLVLIRTGGGAVVLVPLAVKRGVLVPTLRRWRPVVLYTCSEFGVSWLLLFAAERHLSSSLSGLMTAAVPLVAAVLAWATGSDHIDLRRAAGLALGVAGVALLVGFDVSSSQLSSVLSMMVVVVGYALGPWIIAHHLRGADPIGVMACSFGICAAAYAPIAAYNLPTRPLTASVVEAAGALTVVCTIVAFFVFFALIAEVGAMRTTLITYVNPAVAVVLGVSVLGEPFGWATGVGFILILAGCFLATRPVGRRPDHRGPRPGGATPSPGGITSPHGGATPSPGGITSPHGGATPSPGGITSPHGGATPSPGYAPDAE